MTRPRRLPLAALFCFSLLLAGGLIASQKHDPPAPSQAHAATASAEPSKAETASAQPASGEHGKAETGKAEQATANAAKAKAEPAKAKPVPLAHKTYSARAVSAGSAAHTSARVMTAPAEAHGDTEVSAGPAPDEVWADLLDGNRRFMQGRSTVQGLAERRVELAAGQHPHAIVLSCSDSRVPPELVFDQGLGELFVVRTAGNVADPVALGSIEYAIEHLRVATVIVLGHERCGAVAAAASGGKMPTRNLDAVIGKILPALDAVRDRASSEVDLARIGVAANVRRSARDLINNSPVIKEAVLEGRLTIIRAIYHLESGEAERLP